MGRIKTKLVKRASNELFKRHKEEFTESFEENKPIVEKFMDLKSKKFRNIIAGYLTRLVKKQDNI